jgi:hypothetical protein
VPGFPEGFPKPGFIPAPGKRRLPPLLAFHFSHDAEMPAMSRFLLVVAALLVCALPAQADSLPSGSKVEVAECYYTFSLDGSWWSLECRYRIDEGEWRTASQEGRTGEAELQLPGTGVQARGSNFRIEWSFDNDVGSLQVGSLRLK